jgi:hypothetical protein
MILIQVVPNGKTDAYKLLKDKVSHEANTFSWANKAKTKLVHVQANGYIEVDGADGIVVARVYPKDKRSKDVLVEKYIGRIVAWFEEELAAINVQFIAEPVKKISKRKTKS